MEANTWRIARASAIGLAHLNNNTECQDRLACRVVRAHDADVLVAVVADGAGSTSDGQIGAEIACAAFVDEVADFLAAKDASVASLNEDFGRRWIEFCRAKIGARAAEAGKEIREFASTLVAAVVGPETAAFFQVGDGGCVFSADGTPGTYEFAIEPSESEYVNMTEFLTDETAAASLRFRFVEQKVADVVLFSDGIFAVAVDYVNNRPHEPFLLPMIAPLKNGAVPDGLDEKLERFLSSPKLNEKTDDDKTLVIAARRPQAI